MKYYQQMEPSNINLQEPFLCTEEIGQLKKLCVIPGDIYNEVICYRIIQYSDNFE
uniref:Uncharacterized protein n=1 Tax=Lepeophtheirus salmonis TaxID=72036 RepID=A0A0K2V2V2_LEPSM